MKNFIKNNYHLHLGGGLLIGNYLAIILNILFPDNSYINTGIAIGIGFIIGFFWEEGQMFQNPKVKRDWIDILLTTVGVTIGTLIINIIFR